MIKKIWKDPVASKVIAAGIITLLAALGTWVISALTDETFRQSFFSWWNSQVPLGWALIAVLGMTFLWTIIRSWLRREVNELKEEALKELRAIKAQLDEPYEIESSSFPAKGKIVSRHYPYEILECFDRYNNIVESLKRKWPSKYEEEKKLDNKPKLRPGDQVYESEMQAVKSNVIRLMEILK